MDLSKRLLLGLLGQGGAAVAPWYRNGSALANSLVAYWKLDEVSGTRADVVGASTLTDNNTVTSNTGLVYPLAAEFTAANSEYLSIADNAALSMGDIDFWVACWVRLTTKTVDRVFAGKWDAAGNKREYAILYSQSSDRFFFAVSAAGTAAVIAAANTFGAPSTGAYIFLVGIHDSVNNIIKVSVNGGAFDTAAHATGVIDSTTEFQIGAAVSQNATRSFMDGRISAVAIGKNYAPTTTDITYLYNGGAGRA